MKALMIDLISVSSLALSGVGLLMIELWGIVKIWIIIRLMGRWPSQSRLKALKTLQTCLFCRIGARKIGDVSSNDWAEVDTTLAVLHLPVELE